MRGFVPCVLCVILLVSWDASAERPATGDDVREFYRAAARNDEAVMLRTALRLAEARKGSHWTTVVADLYWQGRGTSADPAEAVKWYRRAAVRGGELAMLGLARAHYLGTGAEKDAEAAYFWLSRAAAYRQPRAMLELAIYYRRGVPYARDESLAEQQITQAVELIHQRARREEESQADAMPARRATYVRAFRIFACPWAAPPDYVQARRYLAWAVKEGWSEGASLLPRLESAEPQLSDVCKPD